MSDINLDFTVSNNSINFTVEPNDITITPEQVQLTFAQGILSIPGGFNTQLQYNNNGTLDGISNVTYNGSNISLGDVSTVKIAGGTNGYVLQTDGTGNLGWTAQTGGGGGNGVPGGSNTQIQYNDAGLFGGNVGFTFNEVTGNVAIPGAITIAGNLSAASANIVGNLVAGNANVDTLYANFDIDAAGNLFSGNANLGNLAISSFFQGDGSLLTNVVAATAGTVTTNAQPNITSVGTLTSLTVTGNTTLQGTGFVRPLQEKVTVLTSTVGSSYNYNLIDQAVVYNTANTTANITLNFIGNGTVTANTFIANANSVVATYIITNGNTGYGITQVNVDSAARTINWAGNLAPNIFTNTTVSYTFNLIKTASNTYTVFGSATRYG
jgi:hypothetical protein